jgi:microsomal prostaglandin-E synthase 2
MTMMTMTMMHRLALRNTRRCWLESNLNPNLNLIHPRRVAPFERFSTSSISNDTKDANDANDVKDTNDITLYQYAICPFCNIVKAVLHYHETPYQAVEVNPLTKSELSKFSKDYRKVPILTIGDNQQYNGSQAIVQELLVHQEATTTSKEAQHWMDYAKDDLAPLLYPNLCSSLSNSYKAFHYVHSVPSFSTLQKYSIQTIGSVAMYMAASKIKSKAVRINRRV